MKNKILYILRSAGGYVSGEAISSELNISRAAVWKHIKSLRADGYNIASLTNRGYRLIASPDLLTEYTVKNGLDTKFIGQTIFVYNETDSTNNRAKANASSPDGSLFISEIQTLGKGRLGRAWEAPPGVGIWMSLLLKPDLSPACVPQITLIAGLAVCRALTDAARIKWPNDIVIGSKKVCGILTEMSAEINRVNYVVCGIGVNVNTPSFDGGLSEKATSLFIETGEKHNRAAIARRILTEFEALYTDFLKNGLANILPEYKSRCVTLEREVRVMRGRETIIAKAVDVAEDGSLVIERGGERITVNSGEVSVRGIYGYV